MPNKYKDKQLPLLNKPQSEKKRKLYNIKFCFHGCVYNEADKLTFRQHIDDAKNQVVELLKMGYVAVSNEIYTQWYNEQITIDYPIFAIDLDDGLDSIVAFCEWMIDNNIPFNLGIISRRNKQHKPEQGFISWEQLKIFASHPECTLSRHTHNIHNLTIVDVNGNAAPVLEGPCWIDDPVEYIYHPEQLNEWYWHFNIIDRITLGFPLLGSDPYDNYNTPINSTIHFKASNSLTVDRLRLWCSLHRPYGSGYNCNVEIFVNGTSLGVHTITPKNYETRTQWVEREFYTLILNNTFDIVAGNTYDIEFKTINVGKGAFLIYALPYNYQSTDFYAVTSCKSLVPGKIGNNYADYPAGREWPVQACIILASGQGRQATQAEFDDYIDTDCTQQEQAFSKYLNADWYDIKEKLLPETYPSLKGIAIAGCYEDGTTITGYLSLTASLPADYPDQNATTITIEELNVKYTGRVGLRYALLVDVYISAGADANGPYTKIGQWVPGWSFYHWESFDIDPTVLTVGQKYWFKFETKTRSYNGDYDYVDDPDNPGNKIPGTNLGIIRIYMQQPGVQYLQNAGQLNITNPNSSNEQIVVIDDTVYLKTDLKYIYVDNLPYYTFKNTYNEYFPEFSIRQGDYNRVYFTPAAYDFDYNPYDILGHTNCWTTDDKYTDIWVILRWPFSDTGWIYYNSCVDPETALLHHYPNPPHPQLPTTIDGKCLNGCYGKAFFYAKARVETPSTEPLTTLIYPFGAYNQLANTNEYSRVDNISDNLKTIFQNHNIDSAYTIWPSRIDTVSSFREREIMTTVYTLPRLMTYGDVPNEHTLNYIGLNAGLIFPDAEHGGVNWQISIEADPSGHAVIKERYAQLTYVAFDAYYFRKPDSTHTTGWIETGELNDGGTYNGVTYDDEKAFLQSKGIICTLIISNYSFAIDDVDPNIASYVVNNKSEYITNIVNLCVSNNWDGITLNLEAVPASDRNSATDFIITLAQQLHAQNKILHITAPAKTNTDYDIGSEWWFGWCNHAELIKYVDAMKIMTYTESGPGDDPGPHASDWFYNATYKYISDIIPKEYYKRILCGCNAFGHKWNNNNVNNVDYITYNDAIADCIIYSSPVYIQDTEARAVRNNAELWFATPLTINRAVDFANKYGFGGIGLWKGDDGDLYEFHPFYQQIGYYKMSSFIDVTLSDNIAYGFTGGPEYKTTVTDSDSGYEQRNLHWLYPLHKYTIKLSQMTDAEMLNIISLFKITKGKFHSFRFKDWTDYQGIDENIGTGDGATLTFQLSKAYSYGTQVENRVITKPRQNTVIIKINGTTINQTEYTIDYLTGIVTFNNPPANGSNISASFEFDVPVRFDIDYLPVTISDFETNEVRTITLKEVRE